MLYKLVRKVLFPFTAEGKKQKKQSELNKKAAKSLSALIENKGYEEKRIFYLGTTTNVNLGDNAQHYCIKLWIAQNYPSYKLYMYDSYMVCDDRYGFIRLFSKVYRPSDIIIFQSGYTTQDLGGNHDYMHRLVVKNLPNAHILMMPQTIFFKNEENRKRTAQILNKAHNMLFLARDYNSYEQAKVMFPDINVLAFPDIVTTLIGRYSFDFQRNGVCLCVRNDGEKFYTDDEIDELRKRLAMSVYVELTDTNSNLNAQSLRDNMNIQLEGIIKRFSKFEAIITDRYHGTIFSLCAGTPVIIIQTTDHKVITGADWFKGIYDDYIYVADDLDDAYNIFMRKIHNRKLDHRLTPYFNDKYYAGLYDIFNQLNC